jgi:hypothetical protein
VRRDAVEAEAAVRPTTTRTRIHEVTGAAHLSARAAPPVAVQPRKRAAAGAAMSTH